MAHEHRSKPTEEEAQAAVRTLIEWAATTRTARDCSTRRGGWRRPIASCSRATRSIPRTTWPAPSEEVGGYDELVILKDIRVVSFCEHHMLPFLGKAHVGYLPNDRVVGISKLARVVHGFARRLQIQEKLTAEIAEAIQDILKPKGWAW